MTTIAVGNQKGGVGKTTTTAALAVVLSQAGARVHAIDLDPQSSLTKAFGQRDEKGLLYRALKKRAELPVVRINDQLSLTPSNIDLASGESEFLAVTASEFLLRESLKATALPDDTIVLIDCPPSLGVLSVNCLTAAEWLVLAVHPGQWEVEALIPLQETVDVVKRLLNPKLQIAGVVLTKADVREKVTATIYEQIGQVYTLLGMVRSETRLKYACGEGRIAELRGSTALEEYRQVAEKLAEMLWVTEKATQ